MGLTIKSREYFSMATGQPISSPGGVGCNSNGVGISEKITITTDNQGGSRLDVSGLTLVTQNTASLRIYVTNDTNVNFIYGGTSGIEVNTDGSIGVNYEFQPQKTYYVWLFCVVGAMNGVSHYYSDGNLTLWVSDTYFTFAVPVAADGYFGDEVPIELVGGREDSNFSVYVICNGETETLWTNRQGSSLVWSADLEKYAALLTSDTYARVQIKCDTYFSDVLLGTVSTTITMRFADEDMVPQKTADTWVTDTYYNTSSGASSLTAYVQGFSKARIVFDLSKIDLMTGATLQSFSIVQNGVTKTAESIGSNKYQVITDTLLSASQDILCVVQDSRGYTYSETKTITTLSYAPPTISSPVFYRCDSEGHASDSGTYISIQATCMHSSVGGNTQQYFRIYTKRSDLTSYTLVGEYTANYSGQAVVIGADSGSSSYDTEKAYDIKLELADKVTRTTYYGAVSKRGWAMKFRPSGYGVGFGKAPDADNELQLPAGWSIRIGDSVFVETATISLYKRSSGAPSKPGSGLTYDFETGTLSGTMDGWSTTIPDSGSTSYPCYITQVLAISTSGTCEFEQSDWSTPVIFIDEVTDGYNVAQIMLYQRSAGAPSLPTGALTYTFSTASLAPASNYSPWQIAVPNTDGNPCWVTHATALSAEDTDTIAVSEWSTPVKLVEDGENGYSMAVIHLYSNTKTAVDWTDTLTYTFSTGALSSVPSGWSLTQPANGTIYMTTATARANTATDTIAYTEWSTPICITGIKGDPGSNGTNGYNNATVSLYARGRAVIMEQDSARPSNTIKYSFATGKITEVDGVPYTDGTALDSLGWSTTVPETNGDPCWVTQRRLSSRESTITFSGQTDWSTPVQYAEADIFGGQRKAFMQAYYPIGTIYIMDPQVQNGTVYDALGVPEASNWRWQEITGVVIAATGGHFPGAGVVPTSSPLVTYGSAEDGEILPYFPGSIWKRIA